MKPNLGTFLQYLTKSLPSCLHTSRKLQSTLKAKEAELESHRNTSKQQLSLKDNEHQKQVALALAQARKTAETEAKTQSDQYKKQSTAKESEFQAQLAQLRKTNITETERLQRRTEAETADLKATISRLEVDLMKVRTTLLPNISIKSETNLTQANKSKTQETQALREAHAAALEEGKKQLDAASEKTNELEQDLGEAQKLADESSAKSKRVKLRIFQS